MSNHRATFGHVIEGDKSGYYYNRIGQWAAYKSPADAYVWSDAEAAAIIDAAGKAGNWQIKPVQSYPAVYDDRTGVTVVTGKAEKIKTAHVEMLSFGGTRATVPVGDGTVFALDRIVNRLGHNSVAMASASL